MGYSHKYDTYFNDKTGEWTEKIGFCEEEDNCEYCRAYNEDGRPATAFDAPEDAIEKDEDWLGDFFLCGLPAYGGPAYF